MQQAKFQQQLRQTVPNTTEEIDQFSVDAVKNLELTWLFPQQYRTGAAEDIHKAVVVRWKHAIKDRQQVRLVANAGDW